MPSTKIIVEDIDLCRQCLEAIVTAPDECCWHCAHELEREVGDEDPSVADEPRYRN
jgi:hypothetical protein